jgi:hypothetical protein
MALGIMFQLVVPQALVGADGEEHWQLVAGAATMDELEAYARSAKIPRWVIVVATPIREFPPAGGGAIVGANLIGAAGGGAQVN